MWRGKIKENKKGGGRTKSKKGAVEKNHLQEVEKATKRCHNICITIIFYYNSS
jgi:hypothetical protein